MSDDAAFHVYRGEDGGGPPERLTDTPVTDRFFLDTTRDPARTYRYTVTAMDAADPPNESPASLPVTVAPRP